MADVLLTTVLPLALAFIMFALGLGLTLADFARVAARPAAVATGLAAQIVGIPVAAFLLLQVMPLAPALGLGVMILALCPGGVTSNMLTRLAGGSVALSITLTACASLLCALTVPPMVAWSARTFMGEAAPSVDVLGLGLAMFAITTAPALAGVALRRLAPAFAERAEPTAARIATGLFIVIILGAIGANWQVVVDVLPTLGPLLIALNVLLLGLGLGLGMAMGLGRRQSVAVAMELGIQNGTLGLAVGGMVAGGASVLPAFALPSGGYGMTMYLVALPFALWARRWTAVERAAQVPA